MRPKKPPSMNDHDMFRLELVNLIDQRHELGRQVELIDRVVFYCEFNPQFVSTIGRPALPTRLMVGLPLYLLKSNSLTG